MICLGLDEGEPFWCAGNLYSMLIPRDVTKCFEAVLETVEPGRATPPNAHDTFAQLYVLLRGTGRLYVADEVRDRRRTNPFASLVRLDVRLEAVR